MSSVIEYQPKTHPISVDDLTRMVAAGIIMEDARVELIEGELIDMPPIGAPHSGLVNRLNRLLVLATLDKAVVSVQNGLRLGDFSLPQPDFVILRPQTHDYMLHLPAPKDVLLVVEVAHTTLSYDRGRKMPLYARHGIAESWVIDVTGHRVLRYLGPGETGYQAPTEISGRIALSQAPDCVIDLTDLFKN